MLIAALGLAPAVLAQQTIEVQLAFSPGGRDAYLYVGEEKGYFAAEGLKVNITAGNGGVNMARNVDQRQFFIGNGADLSALLPLRAAGSDLVGVMVLNAQSPYGFQSFASKGITTPKAMEGFTIGIEPGSMGERILIMLMGINGADYSKINVIPMDGSQYVGALLSGQIDIISGFADSLYGVVKVRAAQRGETLNAIWAGDWGLDTYGTFVVVKEETLRNEPELVEAFLRAAKRAVDDVKANPAEAAKIMAGQLVGAGEQVVLAQGEEGLAGAFDETSAALGFGCANMDKMQRSVDVFAEALELDSVAASTLFTNDYMAWCR